MEIARLSSKCFNGVERALQAMKSGDARLSAVILQSIKQDGLLLQQKASSFRCQLNDAENTCQQTVEYLTRQINALYAEEVELQNRKQALEKRKSIMTDQRAFYSRKKQDALMRYQKAKNEKRDAQSKYDSFKYLWWMPIFGWILAVRELIEDNENKARDANREMMRYERETRSAEQEIRWANLAFWEAGIDQNKISRNLELLRSQRQECHEERSGVKSLTSFVMQAVAFWKEVNMLTKGATVKTEDLQKIVNLAAKSNTVNILRASGTQTKISSFKDCWMKVAEMIASDRNSLVFNGNKYSNATLNASVKPFAS